MAIRSTTLLHGTWLGSTTKTNPRSSETTIRQKRVRTDSSLDTHSDSDRKSTRLNSSHVSISYAVFCLKKKKKKKNKIDKRMIVTKDEIGPTRNATVVR